MTALIILLCCVATYHCLFLWQHVVSGEIVFYVKGADAVMTSIVQYSDWLEEEVHEYTVIILK